MAANVEIKARVADPAALERRAAALADGPVEILRQEDVFFAAPRGRLKLRIFPEPPAELIFYRRPDATGTKVSDYHIARTAEPAALRDVLGRCLGERIVVRKVRRLYRVGPTRIHLDRVEGLGDFMELEVVLRPGQDPAEGRPVAEALMRQLGIAEDDLVSGAYADHLEHAAAGGREPTHG